MHCINDSAMLDMSRHTDTRVVFNAWVRAKRTSAVKSSRAGDFSMRVPRPLLCEGKQTIAVPLARLSLTPEKSWRGP